MVRFQVILQFESIGSRILGMWPSRESEEAKMTTNLGAWETWKLVFPFPEAEKMAEEGSGLGRGGNCQCHETS